MQIEAIYREGRVQFTKPIQLKNHPIRVRIDIPDDEIDSAESHQEFDLALFSTQVQKEVERLKALQVSSAADELGLEEGPANEEDAARWAGILIRNESSNEQGR
ncbi:hypothetical protein D5125_14720 [Magnetovirga frankeli]|uniref:hypothetical protein n=1 Tax=Magnetovirga frankeli TaxID=947516 RepID=UPI001293E07E|nr:hypothetical protein D5125_14720 [gamma proteobacterium SS-5]